MRRTRFAPSRAVILRVILSVILSVVVTGAFSACSPTPVPSPPTAPTPFGTTTPTTATPPTTTTTSNTATSSTTGRPPTGSATSTTAGRPALGKPTARELARARADVAGLSDEQLVGQLIVAAYSGTDPAGAAAVVRRGHLAGVITLGDNVPRPITDRVPALRALTHQVQQAVTQDQRDWPAFIGIDQEGGQVTRVGAPLDHWPAAMAFGAADDAELTRRSARASGQQLRALGYTVVFAPDADVTSGPQDTTIGSRSPGHDPQLVAAVATAQARGYAEAGLVPVVKHFPGHGTVAGDTHLATVVQRASLDTLQQRDLVPFQSLADDGVAAVMVAHIVLAPVDRQLPSSLSSPVISGLLRGEMGFSGLVVTDALNMNAVTAVAGPGEAAVLAVEAGADVLLMPADPGAAAAGLLAALHDGRLDRDRLEESAARIVATLRHTDAVAAAKERVIGSQGDLAVQAAGAGLTQLTGQCGTRLVGDAITVGGGTPASRSRLEDAARNAGLDVGGGSSIVLVGGPVHQVAGGPTTPQGGTGDVVVATDVPYPLADSRATTALIAAYGDDRATMQALVQVLLGRATAPGALPVAVGDHPVGSGCG